MKYNKKLSKMSKTYDLFEFKKNLSLISKNKLKKFNNVNFDFVYYFGDFFGLISESGKAINKKDSEMKFSKLDDLSQITEFVNQSVGGFWLLIKKNNKLFLISSTSAPPLTFYKTKESLFFSRIEKDIFNICSKNEKLNKFEIFDILRSKRFDSVPYGSLFENTLKIPGGHLVEINNNLEMKYDSFLRNKNKKLRVNYKYFKKVLENICKLYAESNKKIVLLFSGGIDSFIIFLALRKFTKNIDLITTSQAFNGSQDNGRIQELMHIIKKKFDIKCEILYADRYSKFQRKHRDEICKLSSSNIYRWDVFVFSTIMEKYFNKKNFLFLTGQEMDDGYGIAYTKLSSRFFHDCLARYTYSKYYQKNMSSLLSRLINFMLGKKDTKNTKLEYFNSMNYMKEYQSNYYPFLNKNSKEFFKEYEKYKFNKFQKTSFKNESEQIQTKDVNFKIRLLRHFFSVPNVLKNSFAQDRYAGLLTYHLPTEGPMVNLFLNYSLGIKDIFYPKRYLYKYFKEVTGKSHIFDVLLPAKISISKGPKILKLIFGRKYVKEFNDIQTKIKNNRLELRFANPESFMSSRVYQEDFKKNVNLNNPEILKYLSEDKYIYKFVTEFYDDAKRGLLNFNELQNIYNLEIFLKNIN